MVYSADQKEANKSSSRLGFEYFNATIEGPPDVCQMYSMSVYMFKQSPASWQDISEVLETSNRLYIVLKAGQAFVHSKQNSLAFAAGTRAGRAVIFSNGGK